MHALFGLFDSYSRVARLYPALLALVPAALFGLFVYPTWAPGSPTQNAVLILALCAIGYLLTNIARSLGKNIEPSLIRDWGGWPTTVLLRHSDATIDPHTKQRYHDRLSAVSDVLLPGAEEEARLPGDADDRYRSATRRLIEARRGPEYKLLHHENAAYGFRRNMLGVRPIAVTIAFLAAVATASLWFFQRPRTASFPFAVLVAADVLIGILWLVIVRPPFVLQAAREYAEALLRTLDA